MPAERVAAEILAAVVHRRRILIPGVGNRVAAALGRLMPRVMEWAMRKTILDRLDAARGAAGISTRAG